MKFKTYQYKHSKIKDRKCVHVMEKDTTKVLPARFGVMFDGCSEHGKHYVAFFAVGANVPYNAVLVGYLSFENETDLSAVEHVNNLRSILGNIYKKSVNDIQYFVGDNLKVNQKLAVDLGILLI